MFTKKLNLIGKGKGQSQWPKGEPAASLLSDLGKAQPLSASPKRPIWLTSSQSDYLRLNLDKHFKKISPNTIYHIDAVLVIPENYSRSIQPYHIFMHSLIHSVISQSVNKYLLNTSHMLNTILLTMVPLTKHNEKGQYRENQKNSSCPEGLTIKLLTWDTLQH